MFLPHITERKISHIYDTHSVRFVGVAILNFVDPALLLSIYGIACSVFSLGIALATGRAGVGCLFGLFFFESICYPVRSLFTTPIAKS